MLPFVIALSDDALNDLDAIEVCIAQNNPIAARSLNSTGKRLGEIFQ
jgi:plasmid stabilization system protein ParE